jgi:Ca2+-binding RTX toxin-like protein
MTKRARRTHSPAFKAKVALTDGGFAVAWTSYAQDGSGYGIYAQRYNSVGATIGGEVQVNSSTTGDQTAIDLVALADGAFAVSWQSSGAQDGYGLGVYTRVFGQDVWQGGSGGDVITATAANETVTGLGGNDTLDGGAGNDTLIGGTGTDVYLFSAGGGSDVVDNTGRAGDGDRIQFASGIAIDQLWFQQTGNDLKVSVIGTSDNITVTGWYASNANHFAEFDTADGHYLVDSQVQNLVVAMSALTPPPSGQTTLNAQQHKQLDPMIAVSWQAH